MDKKILVNFLLIFLVGILIGLSLKSILTGEEVVGQNDNSLEDRVSWIEESLKSCPTCAFNPKPEPIEPICKCYSDISMRDSPFLSEDDPKIIALCEKQISQPSCLAAEYNAKSANCKWACYG